MTVLRIRRWRGVFAVPVLLAIAACIQGCWYIPGRIWALQRALKSLCTRTVYAARAAVSVWRVGSGCPEYALIWCIAKMAHRLPVVGGSSTPGAGGPLLGARRCSGSTTLRSRVWCPSIVSGPFVRGSEGCGLGASCLPAGT